MKSKPKSKQPLKQAKHPLKSLSSAKLKKELDKLVSLYVRQIWANDGGMASCYTCGKVAHWKNMHCGHFVSRQYLATRWDEDNLRVQCVGCNVFGNGKVFDFEERLVREIGRQRVEAIKSKRHQICKLDPKWYVDKIDYYKDLLKKMEVL